MALLPPRIRPRALGTPSSEVKACTGESREWTSSISVVKNPSCDIKFEFSCGTPPRSSTRTRNLLDNVAANGQPAVPPPTIM